MRRNLDKRNLSLMFGIDGHWRDLQESFEN